MKELINKIIKNEGATLDKNLTSAELKKGFMVSLYGMEKKHSINNMDYKAIEDNLKEYKEIIKDKKGFYVGCWCYEGYLYIDISECITDKTRALELADDRKQLAIYDIVNNESIELKYKKIVEVLEVRNGKEETQKEYNNNKEVIQYYNIRNSQVKNNKLRNNKTIKELEDNNFLDDYSKNNIFEYSFITLTDYFKIAIFESKALII